MVQGHQTVAELTYKYGIDEWGEREGRVLDHARQLSYQSILQETNCHWELDGRITTIASVLDSDTELPIIGSLCTNPDSRGKGYAKCLVHEITRQITTDGEGRCGIVSNASNPITNRMF
jgi:predicted GNAT family acetyltransferase